MTATNLKNCPVCDHPMEAREDESGLWNVHDTNWKCPVHPALILSWESKESLTEEWNRILTRAAPPAPGEALPSVEELDDLFVSVVAEGGSTRDAVAAIRHRCLQSKPPVEADVGELERLEREATPRAKGDDNGTR